MTAKKSLKKIVCMALAGVGAFASLSMFSACTTAHPKVEMKISFNGTTYTLEYKLYRKLAPSTVQHFLELTEKGWYDGLCIHDYTSSAMYTGGYTFDANKADEGGLTEKSYFSTVKDWNLTQTVWDDSTNEPTYTVYGEFSDNGFEVESGALKPSFGALTMWYTPKENCTDYVSVKRSDGGKNDNKLYKYNSATSLFYINLSSGSSSSKYTTFATLSEDSTDTLTDLKTAISTYITDEYEGETTKFAPDAKLIMDEDDKYVGAAKDSRTFAVPLEPIVISSVKVKSY